MKTKVNVLDYDKYNKFKWHLGGSGKSSVQGRINKTKNKVYLHRLIMDCPKGLVVDHINGDTLDNRRFNLRVCSHTDNCRNTFSKKGTSKYKGVSWSITRKKWCVYIRYNNKTYNLGRYNEEQKAGKIYDKSAKKLFGKYARLNFPRKNNYEFHPIVKMWKGYELALLVYGMTICLEWILRGYKDNMLKRFHKEFAILYWKTYPNKFFLKTKFPKWLGNRKFHKAMKSNLLRKDKKFYSKYKWNVPNNLPYVWIIKE